MLACPQEKLEENNTYTEFRMNLVSGLQDVLKSELQGMFAWECCTRLFDGIDTAHCAGSCIVHLEWLHSESFTKRVRPQKSSAPVSPRLQRYRRRHTAALAVSIAAGIPRQGLCLGINELLPLVCSEQASRCL